jgi:hypothetical protein
MRKGLYDIIVVFFLIIVLIAAVIAFLTLNAGSSMLYVSLRKQAAGPREAAAVKDALLACHRIDYLIESQLGETDCRADTMLGGYAVTRLALNDCEPASWDHRRGTATDTAIPFIVTVEDGGGKRCLSRLDVFVRGTA